MQEPAEMARKQSVPGPGQYKSIGITSNGKYTVSTMPNSKAQVWSPAKGKRFQDDVSRLTIGQPEPGTYHPSDTHSQNDSYILSTFKNNGTTRIIPASRMNNGYKEQLNQRKRTPGPGSYIIPSDFGTIVSDRLMSVTSGQFAQTEKKPVNARAQTPSNY